MVAATSTIIAAAGVATSAIGLFESSDASSDTRALQREQVALANQQQSLTQQASQEQADITREQEALRREEARSNFTRTRRNAIRQAQIARAQATNNAANSGGLQSSSFAGGQAQIASSLGSNLAELNEAFERGETNFELNAALVDSQERLNIGTGRINQQQANLSTSISNSQADAQFGNTLFSIGNTFTANSQTIGRVTDTLFS